MRKLLVLLLILSALWSGYWFAGSSAVRQGAESFFADAAAQGLVAEKTALSVQGFPNRFDLTVEGVNIFDPDTGIGWQAPFAQVFAMTWKPWHIIAAFPPEQVLTLPDQSLVIASTGLKASLRASPSTDLPLAAVVIESDAITATSDAGWTLATARIVASIETDEELGRRAGVAGAPDDPNTYSLSLGIVDLAPDPDTMAAIAAEADLPLIIAESRLLATARTTAPLDRHMGRTQPMLTGLDLHSLKISWGDLVFTASGSIAPDAAGFAAGRIEFSVTSWQKLVPVLVATGTIKPDFAPTLTRGLQALTAQSPDPDVLSLPLILSEGRMSFGPFPLGPAPLMVPPSG